MFRQNYISIHALLAESDYIMIILICIVLRFLSTLSLRRATAVCNQLLFDTLISIHALLAESDQVFQRIAKPFRISIHALLAESDGKIPANTMSHFDFYPRSPCGERPWSVNNPPSSYTISIHALLAESDHGQSITLRLVILFLSTLSLRRAT